MYKDKGIDVVLLDGVLDTRFSDTVERYKENVKFKRVDSDLSALKDEGESEENTQLSEIFAKASGIEKLAVKIEALSDEKVPALLTVNEEAMRINEMMKMYAPDMPEQPVEMTLALNKNNEIVKKLSEGAYGDNAEMVARQIYSLALISQRKLTAEEMQSFLDNSYDMLSKI